MPLLFDAVGVPVPSLLLLQSLRHQALSAPTQQCSFVKL